MISEDNLIKPIYNIYIYTGMYVYKDRSLELHLLSFVLC
jgi:hypothetical protein